MTAITPYLSNSYFSSINLKQQNASIFTFQQFCKCKHIFKIHLNNFFYIYVFKKMLVSLNWYTIVSKYNLYLLNHKLIKYMQVPCFRLFLINVVWYFTRLRQLLFGVHLNPLVPVWYLDLSFPYRFTRFDLGKLLSPVYTIYIMVFSVIR